MVMKERPSQMEEYKYSGGHLNEVTCRFNKTIVANETTLVSCGPDQEPSILESSGQHCRQTNCAGKAGARTQICVQHHKPTADDANTFVVTGNAPCSTRRNQNSMATMHTGFLWNFIAKLSLFSHVARRCESLKLNLPITEGPQPVLTVSHSYPFWEYRNLTQPSKMSGMNATVKEMTQPATHILANCDGFSSMAKRHHSHVRESTVLGLSTNANEVTIYNALLRRARSRSPQTNGHSMLKPT